MSTWKNRLALMEPHQGWMLERDDGRFSFSGILKVQSQLLKGSLLLLKDNSIHILKILFCKRKSDKGRQVFLPLSLCFVLWRWSFVWHSDCSFIVEYWLAEKNVCIFDCTSWFRVYKCDVLQTWSGWILDVWNVWKLLTFLLVLWVDAGFKGKLGSS